MPATEDKAPAEPEPVSQRPLADVQHDEGHSEDEHVDGLCPRRLIRRRKKLTMHSRC